MPSLFKRSKDDKSLRPSSSNISGSRDEALPAYTPEATTGANASAGPPNGADNNDIDITAAFANLEISAIPQDPTVATCLAHLKLLFAIQSMKEDVGYTDGLWNIWDSRASKDELPPDDPALTTLPDGRPIEKLAPEDEKKILLSKIREKRWALFVARAADRYEAWWNSLERQMLREVDMTMEGVASYVLFPYRNDQMHWTPLMLPPLDVLMVMHAHMLNPRSFLEDTMRNGLGTFWSTGMPWNVINAAIDSDFNYNVSDDAKAYWVAQTGRSWENADDPMMKTLRCPACSASIEIPWTTCGLDELYKGNSRPGLIGSGYGDGKFLLYCPSCSIQIDKELLSVAKFVRDTQDLLARSVPMPGTILEPGSGMPEAIQPGIRGQTNGRTFPNRMIQRALRIQIVDLIRPGAAPRPTMETVRDLIEKTLGDNTTLKAIDDLNTGFGRRYVLNPQARVSVRKMMSRYWENFSPFALDLSGAVMRQGIFTEKMYRIDWLHSPSASDTMSRLIKKYTRFIEIMAAYSTKTAVPTLDVDLAWHTHQLSPSAYYRYTVERTTKFINHDDKIDEDKLGQAFEWTSKIYQERYGEVYSECTCWYCETIRASHISSVGKLLGVSNNEKIADAFHNSGAANMCPPDNSAHISAHNAVKIAETEARHKVTRQLRLYQQQKLEQNYQKAVRRAEKKGRKLPPRDQYYDHWGYSYFMYSPFLFPLYFTPGMYYGWDPCYSAAGAGAWANCAAGSCGNGGVAAGACGGPGGCGNPGGCGGGDSSAGGGYLLFSIEVIALTNMVVDPATRRQVYVYCRPIFSNDKHAQLRKRKKIKQVIKDNKKMLQHLLRDMSEKNLIETLHELLNKNIFSSEFCAKVEFPSLFRSSPLREVQRQTSELNAARSTAEVLDEIASQDGERQGLETVEEWPVNGEELDLPGEVEAEEVIPGIVIEKPSAPERFPSLYPSYLPYQAQHLIFNKAQQVLEECCFEFAATIMPSVLQQKKWECPAAVELTQWTKLFRSKQNKPRLQSHFGDMQTEEFEELLTRVAELRHTAVHRLATTARGISRLLESSVKLAQALHDNLRSAQLQELLSNVDSQVQAMELYKNVLEDTTSRKLEEIQRRREELDKAEKDLIEGMLKDDKDRRSLIGRLLEESVTHIFSKQEQILPGDTEDCDEEENGENDNDEDEDDEGEDEDEDKKDPNSSS